MVKIYDDNREKSNNKRKTRTRERKHIYVITKKRVIVKKISMNSKKIKLRLKIYIKK